jgi:hypothetical protein
MTLKHLTTLLAILATMLFVACGGEEAAETTETTTETEPAAEAETDEPAAEPAAAEPAAGGGGVCDRAQRCCEGYVSEMTAMGTPGISAEQACAGIAGARAAGAAGEASCTTMINGWRQGLEAAQRTVPSDCAAQ